MRYYNSCEPASLQSKIYYFVFLYVRFSSILLVSVTICFSNRTVPTVYVQSYRYKIQKAFTTSPNLLTVNN